MCSPHLSSYVRASISFFYLKSVGACELAPHIEIMKNIFTFVSVFLFLLIGSYGCSGSDFEETGERGFAPENPVYKEFRFYPRVDHWSIRVLPGNNPEGGMIMVNSTTTSIQNPYVYYERMGDNTAHLSCNFQAWVTVGSMYGTFYEYDYKLNFTSPNQGTYVGYASVNMKDEEKISGYFVYDSDASPVPDEGGSEGGDDGSGGENNPGTGGGDTEIKENELYVKFHTVSPDRIFYRVEYRFPGNYTDPDDYLRAGICYGTSPHPTVFDHTEGIQLVRPNGDSYSGISQLSANTTYYIRPFREVNGVITYYTETSVKTPGTTPDSDIMLKLSYVPSNNVKAEYSFNTDGEYKLELWTWDITQNYSPYDFGYKKQGAKGIYTYNWLLTWESTRYFYLIARDLKTGIAYKSKDLHKL